MIDLDEMKKCLTLCEEYEEKLFRARELRDSLEQLRKLQPELEQTLRAKQGKRAEMGEKMSRSAIFARMNRKRFLEIVAEEEEAARAYEQARTDYENAFREAERLEKECSGREEAKQKLHRLVSAAAEEAMTGGMSEDREEYGLLSFCKQLTEEEKRVAASSQAGNAWLQRLASVSERLARPDGDALLEMKRWQSTTELYQAFMRSVKKLSPENRNRLPLLGIEEICAKNTGIAEEILRLREQSGEADEAFFGSNVRAAMLYSTFKKHADSLGSMMLEVVCALDTQRKELRQNAERTVRDIAVLLTKPLNR